MSLFKMYDIKIKKRVIRFINSQLNSNNIMSKIYILKDFRSNKRLGLDIERVIGKNKDLYRLRVGDIRFIFEVLENIIIVKTADYRGSVYK